MHVQGWADRQISAEGTIDYYKRVQQQSGGPDRVSQFARLYLAPGVAHCAGGAGPNPYGQLDTLLSWVENGKAPTTLTAARRDQSSRFRVQHRVLNAPPYPRAQ